MWILAIVTNNPCFLIKSLTNYLKPSLSLLNSVTGSCQNTLSVLKHNPYILHTNVTKYFLLNYQFLLTLGVPHSRILKLLKSYGPVLGVAHDKFRNVLLILKDMDFDPESSYFCAAIRALCSYVPEATWESRCVLLRSFGFSDHEILSMFKKLPDIMSYGEKNVNEKLEFFLTKTVKQPICIKL